MKIGAQKIVLRVKSRANWTPIKSEPKIKPCDSNLDMTRNRPKPDCSKTLKIQLYW